MRRGNKISNGKVSNGKVGNVHDVKCKEHNEDIRYWFYKSKV